MSNPMKSIIFIFLAFLVPISAMACKCDAEMSSDKVAASSDIIRIKVTSLTLAEFYIESYTSEGVDVGYELLERYWGPERSPKIHTVNASSCNMHFQLGEEYIVVIPRQSTLGIKSVVGICSGSVKVTNSQRDYQILNIKQAIDALKGEKS